MIVTMIVATLIVRTIMQNREHAHAAAQKMKKGAESEI